MQACEVMCLLRNLAAMVLVSCAVAILPATAHDLDDDTRRTAVVSAFAPELSLLRQEVEDAAVQSVNGVEFVTGRLEGRDVVLFLSGISVVNAAMTVQLALDLFPVERIVFSGIAGGVDPGLRIGDVVIPDRWGQYLEVLFARENEDGWSRPPFFEYPFANFGMMFPRSVSVLRAGTGAPETRFWFPADEALLARARVVSADLLLGRCTSESACLAHTPQIVVGGPGVSGSAFVDNAAFRAYAFESFGARVLDMESAAFAHVAWANGVPIIAVRSLSDLAGGSEVESRAGAPTLGSGGDSVAFALGLSPAPIVSFPAPALRTRRADFRHRALQWDHAPRTRTAGRFGHVDGRILRHRLRPLHGVRSAYRLVSGEPSSLLTPRRHRTFPVRLLHLCM